MYWVFTEGIKLQDVDIKYTRFFVKKYSFKWLFLALGAKASVFSHNISDVLFFVIPDVLNVNLWHGRPIKKIGYDSSVERKWIKDKSELFIPLPYDEWDYVLAHDSEHKK